MTDSELIKSFVNEYELEVDGVKFWTPYFINSKALSPDPENFKPGPFLGKGTPSQIQGWVNEHAKNAPELKSAQDWIAELKKNGVGVDCSGLIYYVLDNYLKSKKLGELQDYLFISRADIQKTPPENIPEGITPEDIEKYPDQMPLRDFCMQWNKDPVRRTNVRRLLSPESTVSIYKIKDLKPGDMVDLEGPAGDHIGLILGNDVDGIVYADSIGLDQRGVSIYQVTVTDEEAHLDAQNWNSHQWYADRYKFGEMRRLKVLNDRSKA